MSYIWRFFQKEVRNGITYAKCLDSNCGKQFMCNTGSTSGPRRHLEHCHKDLLQSLKALESGSGAAAATSASKTSALQPTIAQCLERSQVWSNDDHRSKELDRAILQWLVVDSHPWTLVSEKGFCEVMKLATQGRYVMKCEKFFRDRLDGLYNEVQQGLKLMFAEIDNFAITTDIWSEKGLSVLGITAHAIKQDMKRLSTTISMRRLEESHSASNIASLLQELLDQWGISNKLVAIVSDHAANMTKAARSFDGSHVGCLAHKLHLIVQDGLGAQSGVELVAAKCRRLIAFLKHSTSALSRFEKVQESLNLPLHKLILDVKTRWNSFLEMIRRIIEQRAAIAAFTAGRSDVESLESSDFVLLENIANLLSIFEELTLVFSQETTSVSSIIPLGAMLIRYLEDFDTAGTGVGTLHKALLTSAKSRLADPENVNEDYILATALDPRYKLTFFKNKEAAKALLCERLSSMQDTSTTMPIGDEPEVELEPPRKRSLLSEMYSKFNSSGSQAKASQRSLNDDLDQYLDAPLESSDTDPVNYWAKYEGKLKTAASLLIRRLLCIPAASVASERLFSLAGRIYTDSRASLSPQSLEKLIICKLNLKFTSFN